MESFVIESAIYEKQSASIKFSTEGIVINCTNNTFAIKKEQIKNLELFRSIKHFNLRIIVENNVYDLCGISENFVPKIKDFSTSVLGSVLATTELERINTTEGNFDFSNGILTLQSSNTIFSIPKGKIDKILEIDTELQFQVGETEIVFNTTSDLPSFLKNKVSEEICIINNVNCIYPRSKSTLVFFEDYFEVRGSSYDHHIFYKNVIEILYLDNENEQYLVIKLENPILQGQTKYESIVFLLDNKEIEVASKGSIKKNIKNYYKGEQSEIVTEIIENMAEVEAERSDLHFRCTSKVHEGHLYLMDSVLQFLPKATTIPISTINYVEFSRINVSTIQAKTFDITVYADKVYNFNGINKDHFNSIELYFNKNSIKIVSEVIEDSYSSVSENASDDGSDLSDIIASDE